MGQAYADRAATGENQMAEAEFDYIVVGGGGSGAVLARKLAEALDASIALVEAGPSDEGLAEVADLRRYREVAWEGPLSKRLAIRPPARGNPRVIYPAGRVLGGSTSHNTCVWFRPPASDFAHWEELGAAGWGPAETGPCFEEIEGRVHVETLNPGSPAHRDMLQAARELGFPDADFSRPFDAGVGSYRLNKTGNLRQSASVTYLHPLSALPKNLTVLTDTEAGRLAFGPDGGVTGVETSRGLLRARGEVVLSAGAFGSPKLLMLSGIGPAGDLQALGLAVRRDLPGVGAHLLDHPACAVNAAARRAPERFDPWNYAGVLFARLLPETPWPDIEMQIGPELFEQETGPAGYPTAPAGFCAYFSVSRARSEGSVRLASPDPTADIRISPNFFGDPAGHDLAVMIAGLRLIRRLFGAPALNPWIGAELAPGPDCQSEEALGEFLRRTVTTGYHPAGTCRMGTPDDPNSVVGPDLRVLGVPRLRVADASVFPAMVSVNIAPTCMMVGARAAEILARDARAG
jgi:choline oxidase